MQLEKVQHAAQAHTPGAFGLLSRFLVVLFAATVSLAPTVNALAQQPAQVGAPAQGATRAATSRRGSSRSSSVKRFEPRFDRSANRGWQPYLGLLVITPVLNPDS
jgi:hypothetical protein